ncbi:MAG TPA: hypothetical protein PJ994_04630 [Tepidiformaceae bacterium]|nr:hypothetical protein [Tepidiformaceae bacterium]
MLKSLLLLPAAAVAALGIVACGDDDDDDPLATNTPDSGIATNTPGTGEPNTPGTGNGTEQVEVDLEAVGDDGVDGVAVLAPGVDGMNTSITVTLNDASASGMVAIHSGTCSDWDENVVANIGAVQAGYAAGAVNISLSQLEDDDHVVVVLPATGGDPISCGQV